MYTENDTSTVTNIRPEGDMQFSTDVIICKLTGNKILQCWYSHYVSQYLNLFRQIYYSKQLFLAER